MKLTLLILLLATLSVRGADAPPPGKRLYTAKCARCHQLYDPAKYDANTWDAWMEKMRQKARLNEDQVKQLDEYCRAVRENKVATRK